MRRPAGGAPRGDGWAYEPKWDGFRCIVFRDGDELVLQSRELRPLERYFPELIELLRAALPDRGVVDGEVVIAGANGLDSDALLLRIHPAASRVRLPCRRTPASFVAWDLLALGDEDLRVRAFSERREALAAGIRPDVPAIHVTLTRDGPRAGLVDRFEGRGRRGSSRSVSMGHTSPGSGVDQAEARPHRRRGRGRGSAGTRDEAGSGVGSLIIGLHDDAGTLHHVGVASGFTGGSPPRARGGAGALLRDGALDGPPVARLGDPPPSWPRPRAGDGCRGHVALEPRARTFVGAAAAWSGSPRSPTDHLQGDRFRHRDPPRPLALPTGARNLPLRSARATPPFELAQIFGREPGAR